MKPYQRLVELKERSGMKRERERESWSFFLTKPMLEGRFIDGVDNTNLRLTFRFA